MAVFAFHMDTHGATRQFSGQCTSGPGASSSRSDLYDAPDTPHMTSLWMSDRHFAVRVPESTRTRRHVRLRKACAASTTTTCPNVVYIVRVCARTPVSGGTFAPKSKHITCIIHRTAIRSVSARFGKVDVRLDDRRVYASRFGRRCASWSSDPGGDIAFMVKLPH
jgi:hypothetical protein